MAEPRIPLANLPDAELEQALRDLRRRLTYPATPDIAAGVQARIIETPAWVPPVVSLRWQRVWLVAAIVLLALVAALALSPDVRTAIADRLRLHGVLIQWVEEAPTPSLSPVGARLLLGRQITLAEARDAVDFPLLVPIAHGFADPPEVYLSGQGPDAMVSFVYPPAPGLPMAGDSGVGALLTQFRGDADRNLIEKGLRADDGESGSTLEAVRVGGNSAFWITGAPHAVYFVCPDLGECREERYRLAANVLLWDDEGVTLRLESALSRDEAIAIAESVQPME
jgi:hypothetical protein